MPTAGEIFVTVLGSGTCVPSGARSSAGFWVETGDVRLRLDCGSGSVHAMARHGLPWETLTHQFISHFHIDHAGELAALLFAFKYGRTGPRDAPLEVIGPPGLDAFAHGLEALFATRILSQDFPLEIVELEAGAKRVLAPGVALSVVRTPHTAQSLAVRIDTPSRSVGYTGDTAPSAELESFFVDVDLLIAECSFLDDARGTRHLVASDVAAIAESSGARHLLVTHCYFDPHGARLAERIATDYTGRVTIAADGMTLKL